MNQVDIREVLLEAYAANDAMNQLVFRHLDARAWRASPPRTIAAIYAHVHNNRLVWLKRSAPHLKCPAPLDPERCTLKQTALAHKRSAARCLQMLREALTEGAGGRVKRYSRGSWAPDWPAGASMFAYMFAHEAHHRGQALALARLCGYPLPDAATYGIWQWDTIWEELGFENGPR